jgi:hypothetical protein
VGYTIRVPVESRVNFFSRYESIPERLKFREQKNPSVVLDAGAAPNTD